MAHELERRFARLQRGAHLCLVFDSFPEQASAVAAFLAAGLAAGERSLYLGSTGGATRLERALECDGLPVRRETERGALILLTDRNHWLPARRFDPWEHIDALRQAEQQALDDGFSGLRVTWDLEWLADGLPGREGLIELEARLNTFLKDSRTSALCRYPRFRTSVAIIQGVLRTHPLAVLAGQVCPNAHYEPPEMVLGGGSSEDRVDWMIAQLRRARLNEEKLEEVTRRLARHRAALQRADRAKEDMLAMLAHELRNPLGTINNALQVLRLKGEGDETWQRAITAAERQVLHQALLVDELLEASRVTRGDLELNCESLDLVELVRETVEGYRETLESAGLSVDLELSSLPLPVWGDRMRLSQALSNLLHNAARFTSPGGRIQVHTGLRPDGRRVEVTVRDTGRGIPPEVLPQIFDLFTQADASLDRSQGGLGMGLAVVKGLIEMHGGEVRASSEGKDQGAELALLLPLIPGAPALEREPEVAREKASGSGVARRILVVEDNPDAAAMMRDFLVLSGHQVELASTGTEGVRAAHEFHPEVVLCDLGLPEMDGFEVAARLRSDPETSSARLIAVTGYGREEDRRRSREAGFDIHLTKPVDPIQLRKLVQADSPRG